MKTALALLAAATMAAGCATSPSAESRTAEAGCYAEYVEVSITRLGTVVPTTIPTYEGRTYSKAVTSKGTPPRCRQSREEHQRYADRARTQRDTNARYPDPIPPAVIAGAPYTRVSR